MTGRRRGRVEIIIDEVVLRGVPAAQAAAVVAGFEDSLAALAAGDLAALARRPGGHVDAVRPRASGLPAVDPRDLGAAAARAVWPTIAGGQGTAGRERGGHRP